MTERATAYELPAAAWTALPCGGRALRRNARYEPVLGRTPESPRKPRERRAIETHAEIERAERKKYAPGFFGQEQGTAKRERVIAGAERGARTSREDAEARIMRTLLADLDARRKQGCRTLLGTELLRHAGAPAFRVSCPVTGVAYVNAWLWARGRGSSCGRCARAGKATGKEEPQAAAE